jgi:hypothetical protein
LLHRNVEVWIQHPRQARIRFSSSLQRPPRFHGGSSPSLRFLFKFTDESLSRRHTRCLSIWRLLNILKTLSFSDHKHVWTGGYSRRPRGKFATAFVKFSRFCSPSNAFIVGAPAEPRQSIRITTRAHTRTRILWIANSRRPGPQRSVESEKTDQGRKACSEEGQARPRQPEERARHHEGARAEEEARAWNGR